MDKMSHKLLLRLILALTLCFGVFAVAHAQNIKIDYKNTQIKVVLKEVAKQSGYSFVYSDLLSEVNNYVTLSYDEQNKGIDHLLAILFKGTDVKWTLKGKQVALVSEKGQIPQQTKKGNTVRGVITDEDGEPLVGIVIKNEKTNAIATSDLNGNYEIAGSVGDLLSFSMIGMETVVMPIGTNLMMDVNMRADIIALEDVVVTGYQTLSKERTTGSYSILTSQQLERKLQPSLKSMIEGQTAGVVVTKEGEIEIRGVSTINGVKTPLIVVDGYPLIGDNVGLESINPDNIENITVLKDAVAASIYGARASNGVIVVTTKSAKKGSFNLSYKGVYNVSLKPDLAKLNLATTEDYMEAEADVYRLNPNTPYNSYNSYNRISDYMYLLMAQDKGMISESEAQSQINSMKKNNLLKEVEKYLIRPKQSQQHNIALSSSSETNQLNTVLRYSKEYGNMRYNDNSRFIFDLSNAWTPKKWISVRTFANINITDSNATIEQYSSFTSFGSKFQPYLSMYDASGNPVPFSPVGQRRLSTYETVPGMKSILYHPETDMNRAVRLNNGIQARIGGDIKVTFSDFLNGSIGGSWIKGSSSSRTIYYDDSFVMRTAYNDGTDSRNYNTHYIPDGGKIDQNETEIDSWVLRAQLNYNQKFDGDKHRVSAILGSEISKDTYRYTYLPTRLGYDHVSATYNNSFSIHDYNQNTNNMSGNMLFARNPANLGSLSYGNNYAVRDNRFASWYGNGSYEYNNKYIITGSVRLDLTNFFGTDPKYRYKPTWSVGATYKMAEEEYFSGLKDLFSRFNIRASYGVNGNISLNYTPFLVLSVGSYNMETGGIAYSINSYPNDQLRWEKTNIFNGGIDMSMFSGRLNMSVDFYNKKSVDLIVSEVIDYTRGTGSLPQNVGGVTNTGVEVTVSGDIVNNSNFKWHSQLVASYNHSNVDYYQVVRSYASSYTSATQMVEGYPMDGFWGLRFGKLDNKGNVLYKNQHDELVGNSALVGADCVYQGHAKPVTEMSWTNSFRYGNFEGSFMFIGRFGHVFRKDAFLGSNYTNRHVKERWRQPGDEEHTIYPVLNPSGWESFYYPFVDILIGNASYVKLRDLTLSYNIPAKMTKRVGVTNAKVYFQTRNLFYIAARGVDIDPETAEYNQTGGYGGDQGFVSLQLRPEFYFGVQINL